MAPTIEYGFPKQFRAGDLVKFKLQPSDFPVSESWTLTAYILGTSSQTTAEASTDGADYVFEFTAAATAGISAGDYQWLIQAVKSNDVYTVDEGFVTVKLDVAAATTGGEWRSFARKVLDALEAVIENRASQDHLSMSIAGRSISIMSPDERITWRNYFRREVIREERKAGARRGQRINVAFKGN